MTNPTLIIEFIKLTLESIIFYTKRSILCFQNKSQIQMTNKFRNVLIVDPIKLLLTVLSQDPKYINFNLNDQKAL